MASRTRLRRLAEEDVEPLPAPSGPSRVLGVVLGRSRSIDVRRMALRGAAVAAALIVLVPVTLWVRYRMTYLVSRNAVVKGPITHVGAQLDGVVTSVEVDPGQRVRAGQPLARYEDRQLRANVERAQSRLIQASRELAVERLAIGQEGRRLSGLVTEASARTAAADAKVLAAQSQADDARAKYALRSKLAEGGMIAPEELRAAETNQRTAEALAATADADRRAAVAGQQLADIESDGISVRRKGLVVLEAQVAALKAELALAEADLRSAVIRAPAEGWVIRRIAEPGTSVVTGQPVVALWIGDEVWVETWIDEGDIGRVAVGSPARVTVKPYPRRVFTGVVESIGVSTDTELPDAAVPQPRNTRIRAAPVVQVRVRLEDKAGLFPGLSAVVGIRKTAAR